MTETTDSPVPSRARGAFASWWVLLALFGVHLVLSIRLFPSIGSIFDDDRPVVMVDHAIHEYHGALGARFFREHGTTWGYDPFFMAGYPETPVWDSSSNLSIAFQLAAGGRYSPRAYKIGLFVCTLLAVALLPVGALAAGLRPGEAATAEALALVVFWGCFPIALWRSGLFAFVTASSALPLVLALLWRFDRRPNAGRWGVLAAAGALFLFAHVTAPVLALGGAAGYAAASARRWAWRRRRLGAVLGAVVLALLANTFWLGPLWRFRTIRTEAFSFLTSNSPWFLWDYLRSEPVDGRITLVLIVVGVAGLIAWWADGEKTRAALFGATVFWLVVLTGFGSLWGITRVLEPLRFRVSLALVLTLPAGSALVRAWRGLARRGGGGARGQGLAALVGGLVAAGFCMASPETLPRLAVQIGRARPLVVGLPPGARRLVDWLRRETDLSARILFEDQLRLLEWTDAESTHWTPLLPQLLGPEGRAFVGGIYQTAFIAHHQMAAFGDYGLGDRRIDRWRSEALDAYCRRYNIGWVVCWSPLSKFCFDRYEGAEHVATLPRAVSRGLAVCRDPVQGQALMRLAGPEVARALMNEGVDTLKIYRVHRPHSYFLEGSGKVRAMDANRVELTDVRPDGDSAGDGGSAVLSLHWLDTWRTEPPLPLSPVAMPGDPVPFVRIELKGSPVPKVVLFNDYGAGDGAGR